MSLKIVCIGILLISSAASLHAGHILLEPGSKKVVLDDFPYTKGSKEIEVNVGGFGSIVTKGNATRPDVGYALAELRAGFMLSTAGGPGILRGNWEFLAEIFAGGIFDGPGDVLAGVDIFLRYNFVQPNAKFVPFIQIGGGGVYSDSAHDDPIQRNIGSDFCFNLEAEIGARYHVNPNLAITTGIEYRHISNAGLAERNQGLNSLGGVLGVSMFY